MKNIFNVKKVSLKSILMSLAILFNVSVINGTVAFASLNEGFQNSFYDWKNDNNNDNENGELNDSQPNLGQPTGTSNETTNVDNGIGNSKPMFENLYETYDVKNDPDNFFLTRNFLKTISQSNNCNDNNNCNNNSKDNDQPRRLISKKF